MPELPEVETIRRGLERKIVGLTIKNIQVLSFKTLHNDPKILQGKNVLNVWRRAKMLGINLTGDLTLLFHLKMTGQLILESRIENPACRQARQELRMIGGHPTPDMKGVMPSSSTRVIFEFSDGSKLFFNDQRRFGWVKIVDSRQFTGDSENLLGKLGPEPLEKEFSWELLKERLSKRKNTPIKVAIMDQSVVAGIGNIYASESLFSARIDPRRKIITLSDEEYQKLHKGIIDSLQLAIEKGGSTRAHFVNIEGEKGYFLDYANVYGKVGQPCKGGCGGKVEKITQGGRGTYFCPNCQK